MTRKYEKRDPMTRADISVIRGVLGLCKDFLESQFPDTNPSFGFNGTVWTKEELQQQINNALPLLRENPGLKWR